MMTLTSFCVDMQGLFFFFNLAVTYIMSEDDLKLSFTGLHQMLEATFSLDDCLSAVNLLISQDR